VDLNEAPGANVESHYCVKTNITARYT